MIPQDWHAAGDPTRPRYFHRALGLVEYPHGHTVRSRDAAKRRLAKRVKAAGGDPSEIEYRAGFRVGVQRGKPCPRCGSREPRTTFGCASCGEAFA